MRYELWENPDYGALQLVSDALYFLNPQCSGGNNYKILPMTVVCPFKVNFSEQLFCKSCRCRIDKSCIGKCHWNFTVKREIHGNL